MTDDLSCDFDAMPAEPAAIEPASPWHARRALRLTASDVAVAMAVLGEIDVERLTRYQQEQAAIVQRGPGRGLPRLVARKARLLREPKARADVPGYREQEILATWRAELEAGPANGALARLDPATIAHASTVPEWLWPVRDAHSDHLAASPDAWAREWWDGALVVLDCKRTGSRGAPPVYAWRPQIVAQCACTGAAWGALVVGIGWAQSDTATGLIEAYVVEPTAAEIAQVRDVARRFCALVESARREHG